MVSNLNLSCFSSKYSSNIILIFPVHRLLVMFSCHPQSRRAFSASLPVTPGCDVHVPWPLAAVCACLTPLRHPQIISPNSTFLPSPFSRSHFHPPSPPSSPSRKVWPAPPVRAQVDKRFSLTPRFPPGRAAAPSPRFDTPFDDFGRTRCRWDADSIRRIG